MPYILWRSLYDLEHEVRHRTAPSHRTEWIAVYGPDSGDDHKAFVESARADCQRIRLAIEYLAATPT